MQSVIFIVQNNAETIFGISDSHLSLQLQNNDIGGTLLRLATRHYTRPYKTIELDSNKKGAQGL